MAMYAGQGVGLVNTAAPAAVIISKIVQDAQALLGSENAQERQSG